MEFRSSLVKTCIADGGAIFFKYSNDVVLARKLGWFELVIKIRLIM